MNCGGVRSRLDFTTDTFSQIQFPVKFLGEIIVTTISKYLRWIFKGNT